MLRTTGTRAVARAWEVIRRHYGGDREHELAYWEDGAIAYLAKARVGRTVDRAAAYLREWYVCGGAECPSNRDTSIGNIAFNWMLNSRAALIYRLGSGRHGDCRALGLERLHRQAETRLGDDLRSAE